MARPSRRLLAIMDPKEKAAMRADMARDRRRGIKQGSPQDEKIDARVEAKARNSDPIHIKASKKGSFTRMAKKAGKSVQGEAKSVLADPDASPAAKKKANFARNAAKWKH